MKMKDQYQLKLQRIQKKINKDILVKDKFKIILFNKSINKFLIKKVKLIRQYLKLKEKQSQNINKYTNQIRNKKLKKIYLIFLALKILIR